MTTPRQAPQALAALVETALSATCSDATCQRPATKAGLCLAHYQRQRRGGGPGPIHPRGELQAGRRRCIYVEDVPWRRFVELAEARGVSVSELARQAVDALLADSGTGGTP